MGGEGSAAFIDYGHLLGELSLMSPHLSITAALTPFPERFIHFLQESYGLSDLQRHTPFHWL